MHAAGIDPAIVEIEHRAHRDSEINGVVVPTGGIQRLHVLRRDARRIVIHFIDEAEQRFVLFVQLRMSQVPQYAPDQFLIAQQLRRDRGVRLQSKRAVVSIRREGGNQLADARTERSRAAQNFLREARQVLGGLGQIGEHVPDLRILRPALLHHADHVRIGSRLRVLLDTGQKHRFHFGVGVCHLDKSRLHNE